MRIAPRPRSRRDAKGATGYGFQRSTVGIRLAQALTTATTRSQVHRLTALASAARHRPGLRPDPGTHQIYPFLTSPRNWVGRVRLTGFRWVELLRSQPCELSSYIFTRRTHRVLPACVIAPPGEAARLKSLRHSAIWGSLHTRDCSLEAHRRRQLDPGSHDRFQPPYFRPPEAVLQP